MPPKISRLLAVGALRTPHWKTAVEEYVKRLAPWRPVQEQVVKDADACLPEPERIRREGQALERLARADDYLVCLDEHGESMSSSAFAEFLHEISAHAVPCFALGGAFGLAEAVRARARHTLSLSPMTLPHELARVVLLEQLYRAESILRKSRYHH